MHKRLDQPIAGPHTVTLVLLAASGSMSMSVLLPSLPGMARYFGTEYSTVQLVVSLYLCATAIVQLAAGPLSDLFGRRPVIIACFIVFLLATLAAVFAPTIEVLLFWRVLQAAAASGMVLARAIVRDTVPDMEQAASRLGYITMGMSVVPMIAPIVGGFLDEIYGWKATFLVTFTIGSVALLLVLVNLPETNRQRSLSVQAQFRAYPELLSSRRFWGYSATATLATGAFFAFLGGGPFVATEMLGLSPSQYALYFAILSFGYMAGNFVSGRYSRRVGNNRMMLGGNIVATAGISAALIMLWLGIYHSATIFGPIFFVGIGNGMTLPNANAGQVSVRPHLAGSASGLGGTMQLGGGALFAFIAGAVLSVETGPVPLYLVMLACAGGAVMSSLYVIHVARKANDGPVW